MCETVVSEEDCFMAKKKKTMFTSATKPAGKKVLSIDDDVSYYT